MGLLFKHRQRILPILPGIEKHVDPPQLVRFFLGINMKIDSFKWSGWWSNLNNWMMGPQKKHINIFTMPFFHIKQNPQGFFWCEKPLYIMFTEKQPKTGNEKKAALKKKNIRLFSWSPRGGSGFWAGSICISAWQVRPYFRDSSGPYLGGSSAPSKVVFYNHGWKFVLS